MKKILPLLLLSVFASATAMATQTKYMTSFQHAGAAAVEGEITYEPIEGGKRVKSRALVSFVGRPTPVESVLDQKWTSMKELSARNIDDCAAQGGTLETVTVKAGSFNACKIHSATSEIEITKWIGIVPPTGLLRMDLKKKEVQTREELIDYDPAN